MHSLACRFISEIKIEALDMNFGHLLLKWCTVFLTGFLVIFGYFWFRIISIAFYLRNSIIFLPYFFTSAYAQWGSFATLNVFDCRLVGERAMKIGEENTFLPTELGHILSIGSEIANIKQHRIAQWRSEALWSIDLWVKTSQNLLKSIELILWLYTNMAI